MHMYIYTYNITLPPPSAESLWSNLHKDSYNYVCICVCVCVCECVCKCVSVYTYTNATVISWWKRDQILKCDESQFHIVSVTNSQFQKTRFSHSHNLDCLSTLQSVAVNRDGYICTKIFISIQLYIYVCTYTHIYMVSYTGLLQLQS